MPEDSSKSVSRRGFLAAGAGAAAAIGPGSAIVSGQNPAAAVGDEITLALVNGKIHTMDAADTVANTVTIRNGRFVTVGGRQPKAGPAVRVIDLRGRTVVPGLVEPHIHIVSLANRPGYHTILENTTSIREIQEALAARRKDVPEGAWITSMGGWHPNQWAEHRHPTLAELDAAVPDRPVLLYERFTGPAVTNSAGQGVLRCRRCRAARASGYQERSTSPPMAPSPRRDSPEAVHRLRRCFSCAGCRPSRTRNAAPSTRCATRPASG